MRTSSRSTRSRSIREHGARGHARRAAGLPRREDHPRRLGPRPPPGARGTPRPRRGGPRGRRGARRYDLSFIKLDGDIGCMVNGAGLAMTTMDLVKRAGGEPANFLDIGGGAKADRVAAAMRLILDDPNVKAILVNIFGGITRGDEVARGLIEARAQQERDVPMVVRIVGTNAEEAGGAPRGRPVRDRGDARRGRGEGRRVGRGAPPHEHPHRPRDAPRRPGHHRSRGRVPQPRDAGLRHERSSPA